MVLSAAEKILLINRILPKKKKNYTQRHAKVIEIMTEISKWCQKGMHQVLVWALFHHQGTCALPHFWQVELP